MKEVVSDKKQKPVLDEQTFARLLEAAYVLQEHHSELGLNLELRAEQLREQESDAQSPAEPSDAAAPQSDANADYSPTLAQIVETQRFIQIGHLDLAKSLALIAKRVAQITKSGGAAIAIVDGKTVRYRAGSGSSSLPTGTDVPMERALCFTCFRTGQPFSCPDVNPEFLLDAEECQRRGIQSLIAVPVYHDGGIAGALELYFAQPDAFSEHDVHTCQLMAGLITEAFTRDSQGAWKESQESERASMLEALEKLKPSLAALLEASSGKGATAQSVDVSAVAAVTLCRKCGHELVGEEQFCGKCGSPRISDSGSSSMQSKVASLQRMQEASQQHVRTPENGTGHQPLTSKHHVGQGRIPPEPSLNPSLSNPDDFLSRLPQPEARTQRHQVDDPIGVSAVHTAGESTEELPSQLVTELPVEPRGLEINASETGLAKSDAITWSSAAQARDALEELAVLRKQSGFAGVWNTRRVDSRTSRFTNKPLLEQWLSDYGEESDFCKTRIFGLPPNASELQYIDKSRVDAAVARQMVPLPDDPLIAGFDVSGGGKAWNVIRFRCGLNGNPDGMNPVRIPGEHDPDRSQRVGICAELLNDKRPGRQLAAMFIDSAFGAAIAERLRGLGFKNVYEVVAGSISPDPHCLNMRAYMWMKSKEWMLLGSLRPDENLPETQQIKTQLCVPGYHINGSSKLVIESKQNIAERGGGLIDDADAFNLTFSRAVASRPSVEIPVQEKSWSWV